MNPWWKLIARSSLVAGSMAALMPAGGAADPMPAAVPDAAIGPAAPAQVTTDTPEYCRHLAWLYGLAQHASNEDDTLARNGAAMCAQGRVRLGVRALRRALAGAQPQP